MQTALTVTQPAASAIQQAHSDPPLMALWLHGKSQHSQRAYQTV